MKFKRRRGINVPYLRQGLIYFTCQDYAGQPPEVQHKILQLCHQCGGEHHEALFLAMTTQRNLLPIAQEHYIDESTLWRLVQKFYQRW